MRRLAPVISEVAPALKSLGNELGEDAGYDMMPVIGNAIASLKDEDADFVLDGLLDSVSRDNGKGLGFSPIRSNGVNMFADITMPMELKLAFEAIKANFQDFLPEIRSILAQKESQQSVQ